MASSLRKRLGKRHAIPDLKTTAANEDDSSEGSESSREDMMAKLTKKDNAHEAAAGEHLSSTPPPPVDPKSSNISARRSRTVSPPQSLLDRYKNRSARASAPAVSPVKASRADQEYRGKDTAFSENFDMAMPGVSSEHAKEPSPNPPEPVEHGKAKDTRTFKGVEFEMMGKKGKAGEAPYETTSNEALAYQPRQTRSQSRRQQRTDSIDADTDNKDLILNDSPLAPPPLAVKKFSENSRTPSPQASPGIGIALSPGLGAPTPGNSPRGASESPVSALSQLQSTLRQLPPTPSPEPSKTEPTVNFGLRLKPKVPNPRSLQASICPVPVYPPIPRAAIPPQFVWTSPLGSNSRPADPWGWMKKWTCCQCAKLDPLGRGQPAQTIVEQKVCSRLACSHERCADECKVLVDHSYGHTGLYGSQ
ncbi:hypothetical protein LTR37_009820 [Vermiconidia calcicola]|uniref:Uncharacterized protein n=1 Tax=Vermiconidia calcicola TaxID=1690605 RepID=A0ACC3N7E1_9PEZI|nr:hypothetical protein LTR37_009820 [Vermiconidia calcicola]